MVEAQADDDDMRPPAPMDQSEPCRYNSNGGAANQDVDDCARPKW